MKHLVASFRITLLAFVVALSSAVPALADSNETQEATSTPAPQSSYADQYNSLAAAMLNFYATSAGTSLQAFAATNPGMVASMLGNPALALTLPQMTAGTNFQSFMNSSGATLDLASVRSTSDLFAEVNSKAMSIDGQVTLFGASYATALANMHAPSLNMPGLDTSGLSTATGVPVEGLAFGLFMDKSLTNLVANHPDVFAQVRSSGVGTPAAMAAWKSAMMQAGTAVGSDLSRLPMPCMAEMLQAMATGSSAGSSSSCTSCAVAGSYLHNQTSKLLDPNQNSAIPGTNSNQPAPTQPWLSDQLNSANPGLSTQLSQVLAPSSTTSACGASSAASSAALSNMLPGLFSGLGTSTPTTGTLPGGFGSILPSSSTSPALPGGFGSITPTTVK
jgi:hypothetical protein